jgi:hypothetical protein
MDKLVDVIYYECIAAQGFLSQLRSSEFSEMHYQKLISALKLYRDRVKEQDMMERGVAYCLYYLELGLGDAIHHYPKNEQEKKFIENIYVECSNMILEILTPDFMRGPLPDQFAV